MKSNLTLSLDTELVAKLKREKNYSDLINEQMKGYYDVKCIESLQVLKENQQKTKQIIKENRKRLKEIDKNILKIKEKEKIILKETELNWKFSELSDEEKHRFVQNTLKGGQQ